MVILHGPVLRPQAGACLPVPAKWRCWRGVRSVAPSCRGLPPGAAAAAAAAAGVPPSAVAAVAKAAAKAAGVPPAAAAAAAPAAAVPLKWVAPGRPLLAHLSSLTLAQAALQSALLLGGIAVTVAVGQVLLNLIAKKVRRGYLILQLRGACLKSSAPLRTADSGAAPAKLAYQPLCCTPTLRMDVALCSCQR